MNDKQYDSHSQNDVYNYFGVKSVNFHDKMSRASTQKFCDNPSALLMVQDVIDSLDDFDEEEEDHSNL